MPPPHVLLWLGLGGSIAVASTAYLVFVWLRARGRRLDDATFVDAAIGTAAVPIAEAKDGDWLRVVGTVASPASLESPLGGERCLAYSTEIDLVVRDLATPFTREALAVDFVIVDGTGRARVVAAGARVVLQLRAVRPVPARLARYHERSGHAPDGSWRCREGRLLPGAKVAVVGQARWEPDPEPEAVRANASYRGSAEPRRLVLATGDLGAVVVTDDPRAIAPSP